MLLQHAKLWFTVDGTSGVRTHTHTHTQTHTYTKTERKDEDEVGWMFEDIGAKTKYVDIHINTCAMLYYIMPFHGRL